MIRGENGRVQEPASTPAYVRRRPASSLLSRSVARREFHAHQERIADSPGPTQACSEMRSLSRFDTHASPGRSPIETKRDYRGISYRFVLPPAQGQLFGCEFIPAIASGARGTTRIDGAGGTNHRGYSRHRSCSTASPKLSRDKNR